MPDAAVDLSLTSHPGVVKVSSPRTVRIRGMLAAVTGDQHVCGITTHGTNTIVGGSARVRINGRPAARVTDLCACGAAIQTGATGVTIA